MYKTCCKNVFKAKFHHSITFLGIFSGVGCKFFQGELNTKRYVYIFAALWLEEHARSIYIAARGGLAAQQRVCPCVNNAK